VRAQAKVMKDDEERSVVHGKMQRRYPNRTKMYTIRAATIIYKMYTRQTTTNKYWLHAVPEFNKNGSGINNRNFISQQMDDYVVLNNLNRLCTSAKVNLSSCIEKSEEESVK